MLTKKKIIIIIAIISSLCLIFVGMTVRVHMLNNVVPVLEYHEIVPDNVQGKDPWDVRVSDFDKQMIYLKQAGFHLIPLSVLMNNLQGKGLLPLRSVVVTFDDGYAGNYNYAFPILKRHHIPATIFVIGKYINDPPPGLHMLTWVQLQEMQKSGLIDVEAHSYNLHHGVFDPRTGRKLPAMLARLYLPDQGRYETDQEYEQRIYQDGVKIRQLIEAKLGHRPEAFSWPFGRYDHITQAMMMKAGFKYFMTGIGYTCKNTPVTDIIRLPVEENMKLSAFKTMVEPGNMNYHKEIKHDFRKIIKNLT